MYGLNKRDESCLVELFRNARLLIFNFFYFEENQTKVPFRLYSFNLMTVASNFSHYSWQESKSANFPVYGKYEKS